MPGSGMSSDVTLGEATRLVPSADGRWLHFTRPDRRRVRAVADRRRRRPARAADRGPALHLGLGRRAARGRAGADADRLPALDARPSRPTSGCSTRGAGGVDRRPARLTAFNADVLGEHRASRAAGAPRHGRRSRHPGLVHPGAATGARPLVLEIHGGPHTLYGWSPVWEFQILAAAGIGVFYCNPRGSEGYGEAFNDGQPSATGARVRCATSSPAWTRSSPTGWPTPIGSA